MCNMPSIFLIDTFNNCLNAGLSWILICFFKNILYLIEFKHITFVYTGLSSIVSDSVSVVVTIAVTME